MEQTSSSNLRTWFLKLPKCCKLSGVDMPTPPFPVRATRIHHTCSRVSLLESLLPTAGRGSIPTHIHVKNQKKLIQKMNMECMCLQPLCSILTGSKCSLGLNQPTRGRCPAKFVLHAIPSHRNQRQTAIALPCGILDPISLKLHKTYVPNSSQSVTPSC